MGGRSTRSVGFAAMGVAICLCASGIPLALGDEASKTAKIAELLRLTGWEQILREVDSGVAGVDRDDAVRAWSRFYAAGLTEKDVDAILEFYRSAAGQKDALASQAALAKLQGYLVAKRDAGVKGTAARDTAVPGAAVAPHEVAVPGPATASNGTPPESENGPPRQLGSNPSAPEGKVVANSVSEQCEAPPSATSLGRDRSATGRSVLCACVDEKGTLTRDPVIAESSGDPKLDVAAVKLARAGSGRYQAPTFEGKPQRACFKFAINFRQQE
jgi:hypothetical protein